MWDVLEGFSLIGAVIAVGWLLAHLGLLGEAEEKALAKVTFWIGSPALLFLIVARSDPGLIFSGYLVATVVGVVVAAGAYIAAARLWLKRGRTHTLMGSMVVSYVNSTNLGVPIAVFVLVGGPDLDAAVDRAAAVVAARVGRCRQ